MKLKDALDAKKFVVTSEIQPPVDETPEDIVKRLDRVRGRMDGVAVSELDIEGVVTDTVKTCALLKENDFNAIYQTTTRGKNRLSMFRFNSTQLLATKGCIRAGSIEITISAALISAFRCSSLYTSNSIALLLFDPLVLAAASLWEISPTRTRISSCEALSMK